MIASKDTATCDNVTVSVDNVIYHVTITCDSVTVSVYSDIYYQVTLTYDSVIVSVDAVIYYQVNLPLSPCIDWRNYPEQIDVFLFWVWLH